MIKNNEQTEVYDDIDIAFVYESEFVNAAIERQRKNNSPEFDAEFDGLHCIDCEEEIYPVRLKMQKVRCVDCQSILEKRKL